MIELDCLVDPNFQLFLCTLVVAILLAFALRRPPPTPLPPTPPKSPLPASSRTVSFIVLAHGFVGSSKDLLVLSSSLRSLAAKTPGADVDVMLARANEGRTFDGIENGGQRLAGEIIDHITAALDALSPSQGTTITLSVLGNSLGGLYARYAMHVLLKDPVLKISGHTVTPSVFVTTASPALGIANSTYIAVPRFVERAIALSFLGQTGADLFRLNGLVYDMCTHERFLAPLRRFNRRVALSNAYSTDFLVPPETALFLSSGSKTLHRERVHRPGAAAGLIDKVYTVDATERQLPLTDAGNEADLALDNRTCSECLDSCGWTKIIVDVRSTMSSLPLPFAEDKKLPEMATSAVLRQELNRSNRLTLPNGHNMIVANQKNALYEKLFAAGIPVMDFLAEVMLSDKY
jgi:hypothetical protein